MYRCMLCENIETSVVVMVEHILNYHRLGEPNVLVDVADLYQLEEFDGFVDTEYCKDCYVVLIDGSHPIKCVPH